MSLLPVFENRLEDEQSRANYQKLHEFASAHLAEVLKYGNDVFDLCSRKAVGHERRLDRVLLALTRHTVAHLDSLRALLAAGCVDGCECLLRSILDASFGIAHITQADHDSRAAAYQLVQMKRFIKFLRRGDRTHPDGQQLEADLVGDAFVAGLHTKLPTGLGEKAAGYERWISDQPDLAPAVAEWERLKRPPGARTQKDPEWYTLFGGARDIRGLAKQLGWQSLYDFFYREWSNSAHAGDALNHDSTANGGIRPLRYPAGYEKVFSFAVVLCLNGWVKVATFYDPKMGQQLSGLAVSRLEPARQRVAAEIDKALGQFK